MPDVIARARNAAAFVNVKAKEKHIVTATSNKDMPINTGAMGITLSDMDFSVMVSLLRATCYNSIYLHFFRLDFNVFRVLRQIYSKFCQDLSIFSNTEQGFYFNISVTPLFSADPSTQRCPRHFR